VLHPARPLLHVRAWLLAIAVAIAAVASMARGADAPLPSRAAGAEAETAAPTPEPRYRVNVVAPSSFRDAIERDVGLVRWQSYPDMTDDLLERLAREAVDEARHIAAAEGHFSAVVDVAIDRSMQPAAVTLSVDAGPLTRISAVRIEVIGPAATDAPRGTDAIAKLEREWGLPVGEPFRQAAWAAAKASALATLAASPYAAARIERSEAAIDPARNSAELELVVASGPPFRFGPLEITGLAKYRESLVRNYRTFDAGDPYDEATLNRFVRRLNASGYFASVQARIDPDSAGADGAPVLAAVIEAPTRRVEAGLGYSTDVKYRANANYRDVNLDGAGLQLFAEGRLETKVQSGSLRVSRPPNEAGWIATFGAGAERTDIEGLITHTAAIGTRWHTVAEHDQHALSATYYFDEQFPSGAAAQSAHAAYVEVERYWRQTDDLVAPTSGWMANLNAGVGVPGLSTQTFGRLIARAAWWHPIDRTNELQARAEAGAVLAGSRVGIPSKLLFRTGGDTTVRGYAFESLGMPDGDAVVPGRYYAVGSIEAIHWVTPAWGVAAFVDAGNAVDTLADAGLALGYGAGARVRTPLGPFRLDIAYGQRTQDVRLHLSVGLTF
jgi:translocation and assembly module TamA